MAEFIAQCMFDMGSSADAWATQYPPMMGQDFSQLLSVFIFSYSYTMLAPPWANETKPHVNIGWQVWISAISSCIGYWLVGALLATAYPGVSSDNVLSHMLDSTTGTFAFTKLAAYCFAGGIIMPGIPVFCITTRYDLAASGVCSPWMAMFFGNVAPWLVSWTLSSSSAFASMVVWTSLIAGSAVNFVLPGLIFRAAVCREQQGELGEDLLACAGSYEGIGTRGVFPACLHSWRLGLTNAFLVVVFLSVGICLVFQIQALFS